MNKIEVVEYLSQMQPDNDFNETYQHGFYDALQVVLDNVHKLIINDGRELFDRVAKWNQDRNNTIFNHFLETKMLAEELFESCGYSREESKANGRDFAAEHSNLNAEKDGNFLLINTGLSAITKSDLADAYGDQIFIAIGSIFKLGLDPYEVLKRICVHNDAKGSKKDKDGKILKDKTFVEPVHD